MPAAPVNTIDTENKPREYCGLFGLYGVPDAAPLIYRGLFSLQHRGQEGGGIAVSNGRKIQSIKGHGLISDVFNHPDAGRLKGSTGIGHVRYSTTGGTRIVNVQPLVVECADGIWAIAHNGNLVNAAALRRRFQEAGAIFQTSTDSEVLIHLLADPRFRTGVPRVCSALAELKGAFCFLLMTKDCVMAARDPHGVRPLSIGRIGDGYVFASETCAFTQTGAEFVRDVEPGELVIVDKSGLHSHQFTEPAPRAAKCVFEQVYFARPDSVVFGKNVHETRTRFGKLLAEEYPVEADVVVPIPDSGNSAALGFSHASGIPLDFGFIRNHYIGRTFIMPQQVQRDSSVDMKLTVVPEVVKGKRVVVVDDSIVRGTTIRNRVKTLREAGATEVHLRISCPPIAHACHYGIDFQSKKALIASSQDVTEIQESLGADSLGYLSVEGMLSPFDNPDSFCTACFTGEYRIDVSGAKGKHALERRGSLMLNFDPRS